MEKMKICYDKNFTLSQLLLSMTAEGLENHTFQLEIAVCNSFLFGCKFFAVIITNYWEAFKLTSLLSK